MTSCAMINGQLIEGVQHQGKSLICSRISEQLTSTSAEKFIFLFHIWMARAIVAGFPPRQLGFEPGSGRVGFLVDKLELGHVSSEYFGFPCQVSFHQLFHNIHDVGLVQ
jgi:hypothetical protein